MKELQVLLFGEGSIISFVVALMFAYLAAFVLMLIGAVERDPNSEWTPFCWSWQWFLKDNLARIVLNIIIIFIGVRFVKEIMGSERTMYASFVVGLGVDKIINFIKNLNKKND